jgi:invasion associated locus B (IalB) protein
MSHPMLAAPVIVAMIIAACLAGPAFAATGPGRSPPQQHPKQRTDDPKPLGRFDSWVAATHLEGGQTVCYAFSRAQNSVPKFPGRGDVVLTVTERPSGRDAVAVSAGYAYPANAEVKMRVDRGELDFYTAQRSAFARDGRAAVAALLKSREAATRGSGPRGMPVTDSFSLRGFDAAYAAISKACPSR